MLLHALSVGYLATLLRPWRAFVTAASRPWKTQADLLSDFLEQNRDTAYGRAHLGGIANVGAFQERVPIVGYEDLRPWIDRIAAGEPNVLSPSPTRAFERSSGTTGGNKLIPYGAPLLDEFSRATAPWLYSLYAQRPALLGTTSYWSLSPAARAEEKTPGGIPIGFEDDTEYFGPLERWALRRMMAVPGTVARIPDLETWRFTTAKHLLADTNLGLISIWNPSFLTLLMDVIEARYGELVDTIEDRDRRRQLTARSAITGALWPRLRMISCWTDGHAARFVPALAARFPGIEIQGKGLLATEGVVSIPIGKQSAQRGQDVRIPAAEGPPGWRGPRGTGRPVEGEPAAGGAERGQDVRIPAAEGPPGWRGPRGTGRPVEGEPAAGGAETGGTALPARNPTDGCVAAVRSHFLEFQDLSEPHQRPRLLDQLEVGACYAPILTTGNGFCRYRLSDEVECTGFWARTPKLRFVGKLDRTSDLCGEKITAGEVDRAIDRAAVRTGEFTFALVAPCEGTPPRYRLYLEGGSPRSAAAEVEAALLENHHYRYCRDLGQLGPIEPVVVRDGWKTYERTLIARGMRAGDIKPTHLDARLIWDEAFSSTMR